MADIAKLKKQLAKADAAVDEARAAMDLATETFAVKYAARAVLSDQLEQAEALETALKIRSGKAAE